MTGPEYRPIPGWEGYYSAGSDGSILSVRFGRTLKPAPNTKGYPSVCLCRGGAYQSRPVHVLVAAAFHGPRPEGLQVAHLDGVKTNNTPPNLRYKTALENAQDTVRHGNYRNTRKTECPRGHSYTPENTYLQPTTGHRQCRTCKRARAKGELDG